MAEQGAAAGKPASEPRPGGGSAYQVLLALALGKPASVRAPLGEVSAGIRETIEDTSANLNRYDVEQYSDDLHLDGLAMYRDRLNRLPLLSVIEEVTLAKAVEAGVLAKQALLDRVQPPLRSELDRIEEQGVAAFNRFVTGNLRLVVYWASRYQPPGLSFDDRIQEGNIGLIKAVQMYDYRKGNKFSTYATWWIKQAISRAAADQGRVIRLPVHVQEKVCKLERAMKAWGDGRVLTEEVLFFANVSRAEPRNLLNWSRSAWSLEELIDEGLMDDLEVKPLFEGDLESVLNETVQRLAMCTAFDRLDRRQQQVVNLRFGVGGGTPMTLQEVGTRLGLTGERIRQIESKAKEKLVADGDLRELWSGQ